MEYNLDQRLRSLTILVSKIIFLDLWAQLLILLLITKTPKLEGIKVAIMNTNLNIVWKFFVILYLLFSPKTNFGPLSRRHHHLLDVNHRVFFFNFRPGHREARNKFDSLSPAKLLVGFSREPSNSITTPRPSRPLFNIFSSNH